MVLRPCGTFTERHTTKASLFLSVSVFVCMSVCVVSDIQTAQKETGNGSISSNCHSFILVATLHKHYEKWKDLIFIPSHLHLTFYSKRSFRVVFLKFIC